MGERRGGLEAVDVVVGLGIDAGTERQGGEPV